MSICTICREDITDCSSVYVIPECNHEYHTNCIMTWFRTGRETCPLCSDCGLNGNRRRTFAARVSLLRKLSRKKDAPFELKRAVTLLRNAEKSLRMASKELREWKKSIPINSKVSDIMKDSKKKNDRIRRLRFLVYKRKSNLVRTTNIIPIIIPISRPRIH